LEIAKAELDMSEQFFTWIRRQIAGLMPRSVILNW